MLSDKRVSTSLPCHDLERAKAWYKEKLDLSPTLERPDGVFYECGEGTRFFLYESMGASKGDFTQMAIEVPDVRAAVKEMKDHGVTFESYDFPGLKTDDEGIAQIGGELGAWFKDSEGNLIGIGEVTP